MAKKVTAEELEQQENHYIVNPGGAVHQVSREHALERLKLAGWRMATGEEIARYDPENAIQIAGRPFGAPWQPGGDELHTWDG